ncbi:hypothetical protein B0A55_07742 [Friedmanniomyces simplex]|uniref:NmrA-like domain-containing protein n=1 Tax=Friedmanniomyces simplex TaxID=329884 RepID=A0A4U0XBC2_9PEZI|nr:hypothetical protein B0A55_07742 [Friedmanniomyces simplex]
MAAITELDIVRIIVLGGTGQQGLSVVRALSHHPRYYVSVLTRDSTSSTALSLASTYNIPLIPNSCTSAPGLCAAFPAQDMVNFTLDSFRRREQAECTSAPPADTT